MENQERIIRQSIEGCRSLLELTVGAKRALRTGNIKEICVIAEHLGRKIEVMKENEKGLPQLGSLQLKAEMSTLKKECLELHQTAQRETEMVLRQLKKHMAVTHQELTGLSTGKKIAAGYHSNIDRRGRKLNING